MASSQGGVGAVTALQSHHYPTGPHWSPGITPFQQQHHTARSLDRALEDAVCSGILNLSGRKLREYPGMSYDLTDTTQAGGLVCTREDYRKQNVNQQQQQKNPRKHVLVDECSMPALCMDFISILWIKAQ